MAQDGGAAGRGGQAGLQGPPAHVPARLRLPVSKSGYRHAHPASVSGPSQHPAHRALHRAVTHALQEPLARLTPTARSVRCSGSVTSLRSSVSGNTRSALPAEIAGRARKVEDDLKRMLNDSCRRTIVHCWPVRSMPVRYVRRPYR